MVKTKSREKYTKIKASGWAKGLFGLTASKTQVFDDDLTFINIKKGDATVLRDKDGYHELSRDSQGSHNFRDLKNEKSN